MDIQLKHITVGPAHDPYSRTILIVRNGASEAHWISCGLVGQTIQLWHNKTKCREMHIENSIFGEGKKTDVTKASILFKRWVGIDHEQALEIAHEQEARAHKDPMGPASRYI